MVDKPHGLATQASPTHPDSVAGRLEAQHPYVALHHRLDAPASGLLVLALHRDANRGLAATFREHAAQRDYRAVLCGTLEPGAAWSWDRPVQGRSAHTHARCLGSRAGLSAVALSPKTGRKHQLRIHAALDGTPISGDRRHGGEAGGRWPRLALHAARLSLPHPVTGEALALESPLPDDLVELWTRAGGS